MTGGVDEVKKILFPVIGFVDNAYRPCLDCNATLTLKVHVIKQLRLHISFGNGVGLLKNSVRKRTLAVVNVSNNAEISYFILWKRQC